MFNESGGPGWAAYEEDTFDLEEIQKKAYIHARETNREQNIRRHVSVYKILIAVIAFAVMFCLYHFINKFIEYRDYIKYSASYEHINFAGFTEHLHDLPVGFEEGFFTG
jgi:hypothetical protein